MRKLFLRMNPDKDGRVSARELRVGLARHGIALSQPEFALFLLRLDNDMSGSISYNEFANAIKGDDPLPQETDANQAVLDSAALTAEAVQQGASPRAAGAASAPSSASALAAAEVPARPITDSRGT